MIDFSPGKKLPAVGAQINVDATRGWQNSGIRLEKGIRVRIRASGRYQVADEPKVWWCEPGGVSIRYYHGRPLGVVLAAVRPDANESKATSGLLRPVTIGLGATWAPTASGTLYFRINDSAAELHDNKGELTVKIEPVPAG